MKFDINMYHYNSLSIYTYLKTLTQFVNTYFSVQKTLLKTAVPTLNIGLHPGDPSYHQARKQM